MTSHRLFLVFLFVLIVISCRKTNEEKNKILLSKMEKTERDVNYKKIIIIGTSDDTLALKSINILNSGYLFGKNHNNMIRKILKDSIYIEVDSIYKPQSFDFVMFGDSTLFESKIFLTPGDTISFTIKNKKMYFNGKNAAYNNFFIELNKNTTEYYNIPYNGDIQDYKKRVKDIYDKRMLFFSRYARDHTFSSKEQIDLVKDILKFEYLNNLIQPRSIFVEGLNGYINNSEGILSAVSSEFENQEQLFDLKDYLDDTTINDFNRPDLLSNTHLFKNAFDAFIRYYFAKNDDINYSSEAFLTQKKFIQQNFDDDLEYYAIARMIREYNIRGFGYSIENIKVLKNTLKEYDAVFSKKPSYKEKMEEIKESLDNFNFKLPDAALHLTKLVNPVGDTVTLGQIFNSTPQRIKIIDFWASWCPPCIREIKEAKRFKNKLATEDNVVWIYLSIDKDQRKWLNSTNKLQHYLTTEHQYIIVGGKNSSLGKALKVRGIPRYVIFDKNEQIVLDNAPRPSDNFNFKKVIDKINKETN